ncbi:hypothetical protein COEREDRAFT_5298 [Coemansia reversa NRRL 1564]|uniref:Uncharacterized protein n=1 Tax=Coemansia reversa (strain ATCC 12441 / NRRL 1564) TaxID=763665 RepID=A0A2G5BKC8_COERN|nr:hypothetical protein COEREDRAFT_5298 [Coemansia reversa NRRL 1564]|eukprot:PIA19460.1 hypothetical protein COEREDRAFT_5298 [Coemansia reversa NRRL 1564]
MPTACPQKAHAPGLLPACFSLSLLDWTPFRWLVPLLCLNSEFGHAHIALGLRWRIGLVNAQPPQLALSDVYHHKDHEALLVSRGLETCAAFTFMRKDIPNLNFSSLPFPLP